MVICMYMKRRHTQYSTVQWSPQACKRKESNRSDQSTTTSFITHTSIKQKYSRQIRRRILFAHIYIVWCHRQITSSCCCFFCLSSSSSLSFSLDSSKRYHESERIHLPLSLLSSSFSTSLILHTPYTCTHTLTHTHSTALLIASHHSYRAGLDYILLCCCCCDQDCLLPHT